MGFLFLKLGQQNGSDSALYPGMGMIHIVIAIHTHEDRVRVTRIDWSIEGFCQDGHGAGTRTERDDS